MNKWRELYNAKLSTSEEIAGLIESNTICVSPIGAGEAWAIPAAVAKRAKENDLSGIVHWSLLSIVNKDLWNDEELDGKFNNAAQTK